MTEQSGTVRQAVEDWAGNAMSKADIVDVGIDVVSGTKMIELVVASDGDLPPVRELAARLADEMGGSVDVRLQVLNSDTERASVIDR